LNHASKADVAARLQKTCLSIQRDLLRWPV
jgi:hypothetical protein